MTLQEDIFVETYKQAFELDRHYDRVGLYSGSILIPVSLGVFVSTLVGMTKISFGFLVVAVLAVSVYWLWFCIIERLGHHQETRPRRVIREVVETVNSANPTFRVPNTFPQTSDGRRNVHYMLIGFFLTGAWVAASVSYFFNFQLLQIPVTMQQTVGQVDPTLTPLAVITFTALIWYAATVVFVFDKEVHESYKRLKHLSKIKNFVKGHNSIAELQEIGQLISEAEDASVYEINTLTPAPQRWMTVWIPLFLLATNFLFIMISLMFPDYFQSLKILWVILLSIAFFLPLAIGVLAMRKLAVIRYERIRRKMLVVARQNNLDTVMELLADSEGKSG